MKLTVLAEDTVYRHGLMGEHGLSVLLERNGEKWLFDTGQMGVCVRNAAALKIDLREISGIILSHGHYDHAGGLTHVLRVAGPTRVFCHPDIFVTRYSLERGKGRRNVGLPWRREDIRENGALFRYNKTPLELSSGLVLSGEIPVPPPRSVDEVGGLRIERGGRLFPDPVRDEQCLVAEGENGLVVMLGCAHRGPIAMLDYSREICGGKRIDAVVGGTHLSRSEGRSVVETTEALSRLGVRKIAMCHCTGPDALAAVKRAFPRRFIPCSTGTTIELE